MTLTPLPKTTAKRLANGHAYRRIALVTDLPINGRLCQASIYVNQIKRGPLHLSLRWHSVLTPNEATVYTLSTLNKVQTIIAECGGVNKWLTR